MSPECMRVSHPPHGYPRGSGDGSGSPWEAPSSCSRTTLRTCWSNTSHVWQRASDWLCSHGKYRVHMEHCSSPASRAACIMASCAARAQLVAAGLCACVRRDFSVSGSCLWGPECSIPSLEAGVRSEPRTPVLRSHCARRDGGGEEDGCDGGGEEDGEGGREGGGSPGGRRGSGARFARGSAGTSVGGEVARLRECTSTSILSGSSESSSGGGGGGWGGGCCCVGCDGGGGGSVNVGGGSVAALDHHLMTLRTQNSRARSVRSACAAARARERSALWDSPRCTRDLSVPPAMGLTTLGWCSVHVVEPSVWMWKEWKFSSLANAAARRTSRRAARVKFWRGVGV